MKITDQIKRRLESDLPGCTVERVERTYAGHNQMDGGAWSWFADLKGPTTHVGSQYTMRQLLRCPKWSIHANGSIHPMIDDALRAAKGWK